MTTERPPRGETTLRMVPMPADINTNGHIFGGWVLSQMDIAGGIIAHREAQGPVATVAIDRMEFIVPILVGDVVTFYASIAQRGRTSIAVHLEVYSERRNTATEIKVTSGTFTYVAIDAEARPRPLP